MKLSMKGLEDRYRKSRGIGEYVSAYFDYLHEITSQLDVAAIDAIINALLEAAERCSTIYLLGNGGSAVTASHMANDLAVGAWMSDYPPFRVVSLTDNVAVMTAIANDTDYSKLFVNQLRNLLMPKDVVVALSVSGNSENVLEAVRFAKKQDAMVLGCSGFTGGKLKELSDIHLHVPSYPGEYGPVEDIMMVLDHIIHSYFLLSRRGALQRSHGNGDE
jgi:D-sedoheptulose 7-phosphate isomerase